jgi:hypothetical protein
MTHHVVPLMYLLDDRGGVGHGTAGRSSTIEGILECWDGSSGEPGDPSVIGCGVSFHWSHDVAGLSSRDMRDF